MAVGVTPKKWEPMERVVNIIGMGPSARDVPDTGENWGINVAYKHARLDKMFFFDDASVILWDDQNIIGSRSMNLKQAIEESPEMEIFSRTKDAFSENGVQFAEINEYPLRKALTLAPGAFFTSTIAYTLAYAIVENVDRIRLYGCSMYGSACANEYMYQLPCVEFWTAFALGRGIKVEIPYQTVLEAKNSNNLYGYKLNELCDPRNRTKEK